MHFPVAIQTGLFSCIKLKFRLYHFYLLVFFLASFCRTLNERSTGFYILHPKAQTKPAKENHSIVFCNETRVTCSQGHQGSLWQSWMWKSSFPAPWAAAWTRKAPVLRLCIFCRHTNTVISVLNITTPRFALLLEVNTIDLVAASIWLAV